MSETYTVKQVAQILGYSTNTIYKFLKEKRIKGIRLGEGRFRITQEELEKLLHISKNPTDTSSFNQPQTNLTELLGQKNEIKVKEVAKTHGVYSIEVPSIFEWFLGIASIVLGFAMFLFSSPLYDINNNKFSFLYEPVRIALIFGGLGLIYADIFSANKKVWRFIFRLILTLIFAVLSVTFFNINDLGSCLLFGLLAFVNFVTLFTNLNGTICFSLYIALLSLITPIALSFTSFYSDSAPFLAWIYNYRNFAIIFWTLFVSGFIFCLWYGYHKKWLLFSLAMIFSAGIYAGVVFWTADKLFWGRSFFFMIMSLTCLFIPSWRFFQFNKPKDREVSFLMFGSFLTLLLITVGLVSMFQGFVISYESKRLNSQVVRISQDLNQRLETTQSLIENTSQNPLLKDGIIKKNEDVLNGLARQMFGADNSLRRVLILNADGVDLVAYPFDPALVGSKYNYRDYYIQAVTNKKTYFSNVFLSTGTFPRQTAVVSVPVIDSSTKKIIGVLVGSFDLQKVGFYLQKETETDGEIIYAIDKDGKYVLHPNNSLIGTKANLNDPIKLAITKTNGVIQTNNSFLNSDAIEAFAPVEKNNWGIADAKPLSNIIHAVNTSTIVILLISIGSTFIVGLAILLHFGNNRS